MMLDRHDEIYRYMCVYIYMMLDRHDDEYHDQHDADINDYEWMTMNMTMTCIITMV